jgi:hypothetical protein
MLSDKKSAGVAFYRFYKDIFCTFNTTDQIYANLFNYHNLIIHFYTVTDASYKCYLVVKLSSKKHLTRLPRVIASQHISDL